MFKFFRKNNKTEIEVNCPVCSREFLYKVDLDEERNYDNYKYKKGASFICSLECDFCHAEASIVQYKSGEIGTIDNKWIKLEKEHSNNREALINNIEAIKERREKDPCEKFELQLSELENKLNKIESLFRLQAKKYEDFQVKWRDEWQNFVREQELSEQ